MPLDNATFSVALQQRVERRQADGAKLGDFYSKWE
jgi:hypothetical protein